MRYNDSELTIRQGDLYIYSPGLAVTILDGSADYQSICLMVDESTSLESPAVRDMISQMLMMEACYLLRTSSLSIAQISQRMQFSEPAAFTRFFIRVKGMTPREFRIKAVHA